MSTATSTACTQRFFKCLKIKYLRVPTHVHRLGTRRGHEKKLTFAGKVINMISIDTKEMQKTLEREFWGLKSKEKDKANARALNDAIKQGRTVAKRAITAQFNIKSAFLKNDLMPITKANPNSLYADLGLSKSPIPIGKFKGVRQEQDGVSVRIRKGKKTLMPGAFMFAGAGTNVFARSFNRGGSSYSGGNFMFRSKRINKKGADLPIGNILTASPIGAARNDKVFEELQTKLTEAYVRRLEYHLGKALFKK